MDVGQCRLPLPHVLAESCKGSSQLCNGDPIGECKCKVTSIKPNWQAKRIELTMQLLHSYWTPLSFEEQLTWRKLLTWTNQWLLTALSVTTSSDAFLHKGNICAHDQLSALWRNTRKNRLFSRKKQKSSIGFSTCLLANRKVTIKAWCGWKWSK